MSFPVAPRPRSYWRSGWAIAFLVVVAVAMTFSIVVGNYLSGLRDPHIRQTVAKGEWLQREEAGYWIRLDDVELLDSMEGDDGERIEAVPGAKLARISYTVKLIADEPKDASCLVIVTNSDDEYINSTRWDAPGATLNGCSYAGDEPVSRGDEFEGVVVMDVNVRSGDDLNIDVQDVGGPDQRFRISGD